MRRPQLIEQREGPIVFMEDGTGDWRWAFDHKSTNKVYEAELYEDWELCAEDLSQLLIHNAISEATYNAENWRECNQLPDEYLPTALAPFAEVRFGGWRWPHPEGRIFLGESLIATVNPAMNPSAPWNTKPGFSELRVASNKTGRVDYLDRITDIQWFEG